MSESNLRLRFARAQPSKVDETTDDDEDDMTQAKSVSILGIFRTLVLYFFICLSLSVLLSWVVTGSFLWGWSPWWSRPQVLLRYIKGPIFLTEQELLTYNGEDPTKPIYLSLNGTIYDVSAGHTYYAPGGMYDFFSGHEVARAFLTGCFKEDLTWDLRGVEKMHLPVPNPNTEVDQDAALSAAELKARDETELEAAKQAIDSTLNGWASMFRGDSGKAYFEVGKLVKPKGWEKMPMKELCEQAEQGIPTRQAVKQTAA